MSRREHITSQSYIDWLRSMGCILWLPFASANDFKDRISGNSLTLTGLGEYAFYTDLDMMRIKLPKQSSQNFATFSTGWTSSTFPNNSHTILATAKRITTTNGTYWIAFKIGNNVPAINPFIINGSSNFSSFDDNINKYAYSLSSSGRNSYINGSLNRSFAAHTPYLPANLGGYNIKISPYETYGQYVEFYIRDYMIFDRVLTLTEIRKIQGYE